MILNNLEKTFRSTVGTMRWRIKFMILGLAVIFATRIYTLSQMMLFSEFDLTLVDIEAGALIIGCVTHCSLLFPEWDGRTRCISLA